MARKSTEIRELARALKAPAFGNRDAGELPTELDPVSPTTLVLSLSDIKPYEHNPRHAQNPEFDRLKDSIASRRGLTTPLTVTKRPGDKRYTIAAGGNSRLQALNELYGETGDQVFNRVMCQFDPWDSDCQVLANHLIENDVRGNMTFADKARAVVGWQQLYEAAHPQDPALSQRVLEEKLRESGFRVSHALLARYLYTAEFLLPALPNALASGLGRPQIEELIRLRTFAEQYWDEVPLPEGCTPTASFNEVFSAACAAEDRHCDDWAFEFFQSALATRIAEALRLDPKAVALDLDSLYHGIPVGQLGSQASVQHEGQPQFAFERAREHLAAQVERARHRQEARHARDGELGEEGRAPAGAKDTDADPRSSLDAAQDALPTLRTTADLQAPRVVIYELARDIAESHGLNELVKPCDVGFGYYIDAPEPPETAREHGVAYSGLRLWLWWWLSLCAEELDATHLRAIARHDADSWLFQLFEQLPQRAPGKDFLDALYLLVGQPDWLRLAADLLTNAALADGVFVRLIALIQRCRALRLAADRSDIPLWELSR